MTSHASHPTRMLVIDDRPEMRRRIADLFAGSEIHVYDIGSPLGATSVVVRLRIDVVVVGARMGLMPGSRFAKLIRNNPRLDHVKIVLLVPELPPQMDRSREFEEVDAVVVEADLGTTLMRTVNRLVRRPFAVARSAPVLLVDPKPARCERAQGPLLVEVLHDDRKRAASEG